MDNQLINQSIQAKLYQCLLQNMNIDA